MMAIDDRSLASKYELVKLSVHSSTQIANRTASVVAKLESSQANDAAKPAIVVLRAGARTASKLISITEIAKRDLVSKGIKFFQYTALSSEMIEVQRQSKRAAVDAPEKENDSGGDSDDAFETMGASPETGTKKRLVPLMTVYLATKSIKELSKEYE